MIEYVYGAARALAEFDRETEAAELPEPAAFKPGTIVRTSGGRTWRALRQTREDPVAQVWREVTLVPRDEFGYRRVRLAVLVAMLIIAVAWIVAVPWLGAGTVFLPTLVGFGAARAWWHFIVQDDGLVRAPRSSLDAGEVKLVDDPGPVAIPQGLQPPPVEVLLGGLFDPYARPLGRSRAAGLRTFGGFFDPYEGPTYRLPHPASTTPGAVIRVDGAIWRRWGVGWSPARLVTRKRELQQRAIDATVILSGVLFAVAAIYRTDYATEVRNVLITVSEACLFVGVLMTSQACHRAQIPVPGDEGQ